MPTTKRSRLSRLTLSSLPGNKAYTWDVVPEHAALGVCLERMHRAFGELLVLAQRFNPVATGPRKVNMWLDHVSTGVVCYQYLMNCARSAAMLVVGPGDV